jgi:hypothetical protein
MTEIYTNYYLDSNGDALIVEAFLSQQAAIESAAEGPLYEFTTLIKGVIATRLHLGLMIAEYLADLEDERRWENAEAAGQYG